MKIVWRFFKKILKKKKVKILFETELNPNENLPTKYQQEYSNLNIVISNSIVNSAVTDNQNGDFLDAAKKLIMAYEMDKEEYINYLYFAAGSAVNGKDYDSYFKRANHKMQLLRPFEILNQATTYDVKCKVKGGGLTGQVGAMVHGISKALVMIDSESKSTLKKEKLTTRDSRAVERKKYGHRKARRSFQFSKR